MATTSLRIAVLVSVGHNPVSGRARARRNDGLALELARNLGGTVTVLHAGDPAEAALKDYLALGAGSVEVVPVVAGGDAVAALADRLAGFDLILTGSRAEGGADSGMLPYLISARLNLPLVGQALTIALTDASAEVTQFLPKGKRRRVGVMLPAVVAIHPMAPVTPRYAFARRLAGRIQPHLASSTGTAVLSPWRSEPATRKPLKFKAAEKRTGHARMLSAIATESKGGAVLSDGSPAEKAQAILAYLREHRLIDF
jgi:electron transfer flavoprotein beta subunit